MRARLTATEVDIPSPQEEADEDEGDEFFMLSPIVHPTPTPTVNTPVAAPVPPA